MSNFSLTGPTLFLAPNHLQSERFLITNYLKGCPCRIEFTEGHLPEIVTNIDATATPPFLVDKALYLTADLLDSYMHERYPSPALLPSDPVARAQVRSLAAKATSWYALAEDANHRELTNRLNELASVVPTDTRWFTGPMIGAIDIALAPLINYAHSNGVPLPLSHEYERYANRLIELLAEAKNDNTEGIIPKAA